MKSDPRRLTINPGWADEATPVPLDDAVERGDEADLPLPDLRLSWISHPQGLKSTNAFGTAQQNIRSKKKKKMPSQKATK
jgi:hypothetical protein